MGKLDKFFKSNYWLFKINNIFETQQTKQHKIITIKAFLAVNTLKLPLVDANKGEAIAVLLVVRLVFSFDCSSIILEGDSFLTILAIN